jgi:DNA polymerase-3 subunit alpha
VIEALVRAGALDALSGGADRATLLASVGRAIDSAEQAQAHAGQVSLFGEPSQSDAPVVEYVQAKPWSERERLANEKLALGFYFSGHLFTEYATEARRLAPTRLADARSGGRETVRLAGIIVSARSQNTRRGRMGVIVLDDDTAQLELMVFSELYDRKRALLKEDTLVFVTGQVRFDEFNQRHSISADDVMDLAEARARAEARLRIELDSPIDLATLKRALEPYRARGGPALREGAFAQPGGAGNGNGGSPPGGQGGNGAGAAGAGCRVVVGYRNGIATADIALPEAWRVRPDETLLAELKAQPKVRSAYFNYL